MKKAISVLSGGLDCTVATSVFKNDHEIHAITFDYGQKAFRRELQAAREICSKMGWTHEVIDLPWLANISNSSLNTSEEIPEPARKMPERISREADEGHAGEQGHGGNDD